MADGGDSPIGSIVEFSADVFSLDAVKKAAYRLSGLCAIDIRLEGRKIMCHMMSISKDPSEIAELERQFRNEVLDQDLRQTIAIETAPIRNAVLAYAFSRTGLQHDE